MAKVPRAGNRIQIHLIPKRAFTEHPLCAKTHAGCFKYHHCDDTDDKDPRSAAHHSQPGTTQGAQPFVRSFQSSYFFAPYCR